MGNKSNFMSILWLILGGGLLLMAYKFFKPGGGNEGVNDGMKAIGDSVKNIGETLANTTEGILNLTREEYETPEFQNALKSLRSDCDKKKKGKKRFISDEIASSRAKLIHAELDNWTGEDETKILSCFFLPQLKEGYLSIWKNNPHVDNKALQTVIKKTTISYGDYYAIKKAFGFAVDNGQKMNVFEKILYRCPELNFHMNTIIKNLQYK